MKLVQYANEEAIRFEADRIGKAIQAETEKPYLVVVKDGACKFASLLLATFDVWPDMAVARCKSYHGTLGPSHGKVAVSWPSPADTVFGRNVVIVEDIVDTGRTVVALVAELVSLGAKSVKIATMVNRREKRLFPVHPGFVGFDYSGKEFLVGFGLDLDGKHRDLRGLHLIVGTA